MKQTPLGFVPEPITVSFDKLLPSRKTPDGLSHSRKFKQIISSIDAIGLIEPLTIAKSDKVSGMMVATNNITAAYAQALLAATPSNMLVNEDKPKKVKGVTAEQMAKMEREMTNLEGQFKLVEQSYGQDVLNLVLAKGYLAKLLDNEVVIRFLTQNQPDILSEFSSIVQTASLDK